MSDFAVCEISGKQYKLTPNNPIEVDFLDSQKDFEAVVLLLSENGKLRIGSPYLKEKLTLRFVESTRGDKIRVAKFHSKANYRKIVGHKSKQTKLVWSVKNS